MLRLASISAIVSVLTLILSQTSLAQQSQAPYYGPYYAGPVVTAPAHYGVHHHSSTAFEGAARGLAEVIRSQGEADVNHSLAARNYQEAHSRYLDNKIKKVDTYWTARSIYDRNQAIKDRQRIERTARKLAKSRLEPLLPHEFDAATGSVNWPSLLATPEFAPYRLRIEALLQQRAAYGSLSAHDHAELATLIKDWRAQLTAVQSQFPFDTVRTSLRFLVRLNHDLKEATS